MLLIKANHAQTIPMTQQEEDCFSATSYLIVQLCLHQKKPTKLFYGEVSTEIFPITEKPNPRDKSAVKTNRESDELTEKPNLKTARLPPDAPAARPFEPRQPDVRKISKLKKFLPPFSPISKISQTILPVFESDGTDQPATNFQDLFLSELFFEQLVRSVEDLSQHVYSSYHIKYKVTDRLVSLCSKLNIVDHLLNPIIKCLCSKYYLDAFQALKSNQIQLNPKQLFYIHRCPQFLIQHDFLQQEKIIRTLYKTIIDVTKPIFDKHLLAIGKDTAKHVFVRGPFLKKLIQDIEHLSKHNYRSDEQRYRDAAQQIRVCTTEETNEVESLLDPIIACLSSKFYRNVYENLIVNYVKVSKSNLAAKHLFFMRDCPEFLFRHDYKRQDEVAALLCTEMLNNAGFILEQNLPNLNNNEDDETTMNVHIEAVLYHIKLLNHFAQIPSIRKNFLETRILDEILQLLQNDTLIHNTNRIVDVKSLMIMQSIILLYNLGFSKEILSRMKRKNVIDICSKLCLMKDKMIQFVSQALIIRLDPKKIDEIPNPKSLTKFCLECMEKSVREPRRSYQGIKLNGVLKVLEILLENDIVQKTIVEEQEGMLFLTKFACIICPDNPTSDIIRKIRLSSLKIIWHLLSIVPTLNKKLKSNDLFIDHLLTFINKVSQKEKMIPNGIIWKLGHEETLRQEQAGKKKQIEEDDRTTTDDQYDSTDAWDDSVPFDLMMSYSDDSSEKSLCRKISNRLKSEDFKVYFEKQGKHRLESMKKAVLKQKLFLACLSAKYRASKVCMAEIEYASKSGCPIIPVIVGKNYTVKGWLNHLIGKRKTVNFKQKLFEDAFLNLISEIRKLKNSE
ncbi:unnamed protein product [Rotaria sp. Silwood1]|nr:unnamed protein product [Rotaria sp. Silwood1]